jgi:hypothetical protein
MSTSHVLEHHENKILLGARLVREYYYPDRQNSLPDWILILAVRDMLWGQSQSSPEDLVDLLITQAKIKSQGHMSRYLAASVISDLRPEVNVFTGGIGFSFEKLSAMAAYFTARGQTISNAKLNHLLFYGDFINYYLYGASISGARYVRKTSSPELSGYESALKTLMYTGVLRGAGGYNTELLVIGADDSVTDRLTVLETVTLHWVAANFGYMTTSEIKQHSQNEWVYRFTRQDDSIPYEYARILQILPERSEL